jgi:hypothetical protein
LRLELVLDLVPATWRALRYAVGVTTITILTPAHLTATMDLTGSQAECSLEPDRGTTAIGDAATGEAAITDADTTDVADGTTTAAFMSATTIGAEDTTEANGILTTAATVADMAAARTAATLAQDSTVAEDSTADADNSGSDFSWAERTGWLPREPAVVSPRRSSLGELCGLRPRLSA